MIPPYTLRFLATFKTSYQNLIKDQEEKEKRARKALRLLEQDPFYKSLKSHKVNTRNFGERWSSWITGDLRIIWDFDPRQQKRIIIYAIGAHSGKHREYK